MADDLPYDPDPEESEDGDQTPVPRAQQVRAGVLARRPKQKSSKPVKIGKSGSRILAKEKQRKALELRKGGASYQAIADAVGYNDQSAARKAVMKAFQDVIQEPALEVKTIQIERLNHMLLTLWPKVQQGDERAIDTSLRVMDKIDRLMGTEAAQTVDVNVHQKNAVLVIDGNKDDFITAMKRMALGDGAGDAPKAIEDSRVVEGEVMLGDRLTQDQRDTMHRIMAPPSMREPAMGAGFDTEDQTWGSDSDDVIEAQVVQDQPATPYVSSRGALNFGVDPTVTISEKE